MHSPDGLGEHQSAQRRILISLALLATLTLAIIASSTWYGVRSDLDYRDALADQATLRGAHDLLARIGDLGERLDALLAGVGAPGDPAAGGDAAPTSPPSSLAAVLQAGGFELIEWRPLSAADATPAGTRLHAAPDRPTPLVEHAARPGAGAPGLLLRVPCGEACRLVAGPRGGAFALLLVGDDRRFPLHDLPLGALDRPGRVLSRAALAAPHAGWHLEAVARPGVLHGQIAWRLVYAVLLALLVLAATYALSTWVRQQTRQALAAHRRLTANRSKLAVILDVISEGIILADGDGAIEVFNPAAEIMFGQIEEDVLGAPVTALLPELFDAGGVRALLAELADGGALSTLREVQARRAGREGFPARVWLRRLNLDGGPRLLLVVQDLTETAQNAQQLTYLEQHDVLTGLLNRKEFERRMQRQLAEAAGSETTHVLCYIDIDQFKVVNDTMGHAAGDALVGQLTRLIQAKLSQAALIGRLGGDEFGALFVDCSEARAVDLCDGLMQTVRNFLFTWRDRSFDVAISIGVTAFLPENESAAAELAKADVACHMAKHLGRDRIHVYSDGDTSVIRHHGDMHLVSTISAALNGGRFRLFTQPIMPLGEGGERALHYEILVRMLDEHGECMAPSRFIPAAEQYILMPAVDRWIIHQLFSTQGEAMRRWHRTHPAQFLFAVNLSGISVADDSFLPYIRRQFEVHRIPPAAVCFEVTETAAMRNMEIAHAFMQQVVDMGCSLALDDFGSGLASYSYLRELPVQYLKIDGSFVQDMQRNPVNHALVASINQVAHVLGLKTIAEWAEDAGTVDALRALCVDFVQGYAIGIPTPIGEFALGAEVAVGGGVLAPSRATVALTDVGPPFTAPATPGHTQAPHG